tara:strand:- start:48 stop:509 length:462 start_codon:yes stop_codon:yes gene_type:complete
MNNVIFRSLILKVAIISIILVSAERSFATSGVRKVQASSCEVVKIYVAVGITTQLALEQEPRTTLFADKNHFVINTSDSAPRSLAIIPKFNPNELSSLPQKNQVKALDKNYKTNLFIFFDNQNQLMFELRFVEKEKADYIVDIKQTFPKDCML